MGNSDLQPSGQSTGKQLDLGLTPEVGGSLVGLSP